MKTMHGLAAEGLRVFNEIKMCTTWPSFPPFSHREKGFKPLSCGRGVGVRTDASSEVQSLC